MAGGDWCRGEGTEEGAREARPRQGEAGIGLAKGVDTLQGVAGDLLGHVAAEDRQGGRALGRKGSCSSVDFSL